MIHEALQRHVEGISYRERHAGSGLDQNMSHQGRLIMGNRLNHGSYGEIFWVQTGS